MYTLVSGFKFVCLGNSNLVMNNFSVQPPALSGHATLDHKQLTRPYILN